MKTQKLPAVKISPTHLFSSKVNSNEKKVETKNLVSISTLMPSKDKENEKKLKKKLDIFADEQ